MSPQSELEIQGNFLAHPFAELLVEIAQARLNGSLRISDKERKCVVYFKHGQIAFAVSNARSSRLFEILLRQNKISKADLVQIPNFANDMEFAAFVRAKNFLTEAECDGLFGDQIEEIIVDMLGWPAGEWTFSSLTRIRDGLEFEIASAMLLVKYGRCLPTDHVLGRFRSLNEAFRRSQVSETIVDLNPDEAFVLSRADEGVLTAADLVSIAAMSETAALHLIYTLWLGGLLIRNEWQPAFTDSAVGAMRTAKLELKKEARLLSLSFPAVQEQVPVKVVDVPAKDPGVSISLDDYLLRVKNAETYYDILGVDAKAEIDELKRAYFGLARMFHPDRYHAEGGEVFKLVQNAFTELAQAHETLKNPATREIYHYRMRKELAERDKRQATGISGTADIKLEQAAQNFERGFSLLMEDEYEGALPYLARAVHFAPKDSRYHAYYGKALSLDPKQRHRAEAEMQTALKLDPNNPTFRILLAEFFIQQNLIRRAEGELNRLLAVFPSNREARDLLNSLQR